MLCTFVEDKFFALLTRHFTVILPSCFSHFSLWHFAPWITVSSCSYHLESIWCCIPWCLQEKHYHDVIPDFATKGKSPKSPLNCLKELDQNNETALPGLQLGNQGIWKNLQTSDLKKKMCFTVLIWFRRCCFVLLLRFPCKNLRNLDLVIWCSWFVIVSCQTRGINGSG